MFNRITLKENAKNVLKNTYWMSFAVCLLVSAISDFVSIFISPKLPEVTNNASFDELISSFSPTFVIILIASLFLALLFAIFLFAPLKASKCRYFIYSANGNTSFSSLIDLFKTENYLSVVKTLFLRDLILILYSLLYMVPFVIISTLCVIFELPPFLSLIAFLGLIPYIMKTYSFFLVDYIVAENPTINYKEALNLSADYMKTCRFKTFKLELSFIGWILLGSLLCGIGVYFVIPYRDATMAQLYFQRKSQNTQDNKII